MNKATDNSGDKSHFTITPRLVWALSRSPYDYTLWNVIKDIAGDSGECYISSPDLATLAMMSTGKVSDCRKYLLSVGLLKGELRKDPGYPQQVWHLSIPDLWTKNADFVSKFATIKDRIEYKEARDGMKHAKAEELSPGERGITPHEKGPSPHETKNIHKEDQKEEAPPPLEKESSQQEIAYYYRDKTKVTCLGKVKDGPWSIECAECGSELIVDHLDDPTECCFCAMCVYTLLSKKPTVDNRHPAIKEYQAKAGSRKLNRTQVDEIIRVVGSDEKRVAFWGKVVKSWLMRHYSPVNIDGMLDWFNQGEIPRTGRRKKKTDFIPDNATREMRDGQEVTIVHVR